MPEPYHYVRYSWFTEVNLERLSEEMRGAFAVEPVFMPENDSELTIVKYDREKLKIGADTLKVRLSPYRAVLFQRDSAPFSPRDVELRGRILELYPRITPTPFPISYSVEPEFEVAEPE